MGFPGINASSFPRANVFAWLNYLKANHSDYDILPSHKTRSTPCRLTVTCPPLLSHLSTAEKSPVSLLRIPSLVSNLNTKDTGRPYREWPAVALHFERSEPRGSGGYATGMPHLTLTVYYPLQISYSHPLVSKIWKYRHRSRTAVASMALYVLLLHGFPASSHQNGNLVPGSQVSCHSP
jgi:hypothetical protein